MMAKVESNRALEHNTTVDSDDKIDQPEEWGGMGMIEEEEKHKERNNKAIKYSEQLRTIL